MIFGLTDVQRTAIYDWIHNLTGIEVIFAGQDIKMPNKPLATIYMMQPITKKMRTPIKFRDGSTTVVNKYHKYFILSILVIDDNDACSIANAIEESLDVMDIKYALNDVDLYPCYTMPIVSAYKELSDRSEYHATIDIKFGTSSLVERERDIIENVEISYDR